jgi:hypothetical protein
MEVMENVKIEQARACYKFTMRLLLICPTALLLGLAATPAPGQTRWKVEPPVSGRVTGSFADGRVDESSGAAPSRRMPGVFWTHNDSGDGPLIYASDTSGAALGAFRVAGARNRDWEDIALGPCGAQSSCLYLADTGDNREKQKTVAIYRLPEPSLPAKHPLRIEDTRPAESLRIRYPDGPHDVEAMWVAPNGDMHLVTKGRSGPIKHYRVAATAWASEETVTAELIERLPIPLSSTEDYVTGAGLSPDGRTVAIRSYSRVYFFFPSPNGHLETPGDPLACDVRRLGPQGEGIGWLDRRRVVLTSERNLLPAGTIALAECPLPLPVAQR